jgi:uncharacterized protein (UPF0333 family)
MRKKILIIIAVVLLMGGVAGGYLIIKNREKAAPAIELGKSRRTESQSAKTVTPDNNNVKKACDILHPKLASTILDSENITPDETNKTAPVEANGTIVTNCAYTFNSQKTVSLLVRTATTEEGSAHDKVLFGPQRPVNSQDVPEYGDTAFWSADYGQLNILKGKTWYVLTYGPQLASERNLSQTKEFADTIKSEL